jgi:ATP-dependent RNA helicase HrpB
MKLPVEAVFPDLITQLKIGNAVLCAPPGTGKTISTPLALLKAGIPGKRKIIMLEPRRLAAKAAASMMAQLLNEPVGKTVGYRIKLDSRVSSATRIEVVTEGILTRYLQSDPAAEDIGLIIFDELHERSLQSDLGLALAIDIQQAWRSDLRILAMSATMDSQAVSTLLGPHCAVISCSGRQFPVKTRYIRRSLKADIHDILKTATGIIMAELDTATGSMLVFLPGVGEIRRLEQLLIDAGAQQQAVIAPLYGNLPDNLQQRAIAPPAPDERKIVIATSIAETSLTIHGITAVIDCGLSRMSRFDPGTGMTALTTIKVSRAAAEQRRGRAGRLAPGVCIRLWTETEHNRLEAYDKPEILQAELAMFRLELAGWGVRRANELQWLDSPPEVFMIKAEKLLELFGALNHDGTITTHGKSMLKIGLHPRITHMLLKAQALNLLPLATELAALLAEKDIFIRETGNDSYDLRDRVAALRRSPHAGIRKYNHRRAVMLRDQLLKRFKVKFQQQDLDAAGLLLAFAYPDRIGQLRANQTGSYRLNNGRGARFPNANTLEKSPFIVAATLDGAGRNAKIFLAAPISSADIFTHFPAGIKTDDEVVWNAEKQLVEANRITRMEALILKKIKITTPDNDKQQQALLDGIRSLGIAILPWNKTTRDLQARVEFIRHWQPNANWPDLSEQTLLVNLEQWLEPFIGGYSTIAALKRLDLSVILKSMLPYPLINDLDRLAPTHLTVPTGSRIKLDYQSEMPQPLLKVRMQEMFGATTTPTLCNGQVTVKLHLLSPAMRTLQITSDLKSFWQGAYEHVKKEMKGRYPKHFWPDDPQNAPPTRRTKKHLPRER